VESLIFLSKLSRIPFSWNTAAGIYIRKSCIKSTAKAVAYRTKRLFDEFTALSLKVDTPRQHFVRTIISLRSHFSYL
jgi:hypothetical protein